MWQEIKTAPKNKTHVLLFFPNQEKEWLENGGIIEGRWDGKNWEVIHLDRHGIGESCRYDSQPTHWMPLPELPSKHKGE